MSPVGRLNIRSRFVINPAAFHQLMSLQCVLPRKCLPTPAVAQERLVPRVGVSMPLQVVLPVEGKRAHVAGERPLRRRGILRRIHRVPDLLRILHRRVIRHGRRMLGW